MLNRVKTLPHSSTTQSIPSRFFKKNTKAANSKTGGKFSTQLGSAKTSFSSANTSGESSETITIDSADKINVISQASDLEDVSLTCKEAEVLSFLQSKINYYISSGSVLRFMDFEQDYKSSIDNTACDMLLELEIFWQKIKVNYHNSEQSVKFYQDLISFGKDFNNTFVYADEPYNKSASELILTNNQLIFFKLQSKDNQNNFIEIDGNQIPLPQTNNKIRNKILFLLNLMSFFKIVKITCDHLAANFSVTILNIRFLSNEEA